MDKQQQPIVPEGMRVDRMVVFRSPNGRDQWKAIKPAEVPEFLKHPDTMARLVTTGEMVMDPRVSEWWYRVEKVPSKQVIQRIVGNAQRHAKIAARKRRRRAH